MRWSALLLPLLLCAGCAGTRCGGIDYGGLRVERGMRIDEVHALLGEPQLVYHGPDQLRFVAQFWRIPFGWSDATEQVWLKSDPAIVVWSHEGVVTSMGTIPRETALLMPHPPLWPDAHARQGAELTPLGGLVFFALQLLVNR